jgi:hypothetical protein
MGEGEGRERAGEGKESPPKIYDMASSMILPNNVIKRLTVNC